MPQFGQLDLSLRRVLLEDRPGSSIHQVATLELAADRLPAGPHAFPLAAQQGQRGAGPAAAEEAEVAGGLRGHPGDEDGDPSQAEATGAATLPSGEPGDPLGLEPLEPAIDGAGAAEEHGLDGVPRVALGQQEDDMGPEAAFGVWVLPINGEQFVVLLGGPGERLGHDASVSEPWDYPLPHYRGSVTFPWVRIYLALWRVIEKKNPNTGLDGSNHIRVCRCSARRRSAIARS